MATERMTDAELYALSVLVSGHVAGLQADNLIATTHGDYPSNVHGDFIRVTTPLLAELNARGIL